MMSRRYLLLGFVLALSLALLVGYTAVGGTRVDVVSGEASGFSAAFQKKETLTDGDLILIEDSEASYVKKYASVTALVAGGAAWTVGTGELYSTTANMDIVPNGGTGTLGQSTDEWDAAHAVSFGASAGGAWTSESLGGAQALAWVSAVGGSTRRFVLTENVRAVVLKNYYQVSGNGPMFILDSNTALSGGNDTLLSVQTGGVEKAAVESDGDIWNTSGVYRSGVADGGVGFSLDSDTPFTSGTLFQITNDSDVIVSLEGDNDRINFNTYGDGDSFAIRFGNSTTHNIGVFQSTIDDGNASGGAFQFYATETLATSGDNIAKFYNGAGSVAAIDYLGAGEFDGYLKSNGVKQDLDTTQADTISMTINDHTLLADCSLSEDGITVTPPNGTDDTGTVLCIKKTDSTSMYVTVDPPDSDTIDGAATVELQNQYDFITIQSDGTNWHIIGTNF